MFAFNGAVLFFFSLQHSDAVGEDGEEGFKVFFCGFWAAVNIFNLLDIGAAGQMGSQSGFIKAVVGEDLLCVLSDRNAAVSHGEQDFTCFQCFHQVIDAAVSESWNIEHGEYRRGLMGAAAPIREHDGKIKYALGIVGLFRSVMSDEFQSAIRLMLKIAEETM